MKRGIALIICLSLIFTLFLLQGIIAPYEETEQEDLEVEPSPVTSIILTSGENNKITWDVEGYSANGFKVVWSKNSNPTYPLREGDQYHYYTNPSEDSDTLEAFDGEGEYYVRVCEYLGGKCGVYSNEIKVNLTKDTEEDYEEETCYDSDGGINFGVKGKLKDLAHNAEYEDFCVNSNGTVVESGKTLREHYCGEENYQYKYYDCVSACEKGACVGEENEQEESSGVTSITLEAEENEIEWEVEGYSPNGFKVVWSKNENPSYPVRNGDRYHYYSNAEEREDVLEAFNGKGEYYVRVCEYLGGKCGVYSNQVKVSLTGDETSEKEDEEELEDEYEDENEIEDDEDETEEGTNSIENCNGCLVEEVCYPLGFRKAGQYCFDEFKFVNQSAEDAPCDNNFECSSNLCMDGSCVSGSLIKKVMNWLKNFFN